MFIHFQFYVIFNNAIEFLIFINFDIFFSWKNNNKLSLKLLIFRQNHHKDKKKKIWKKSHCKKIWKFQNQQNLIKRLQYLIMLTERRIKLISLRISEQIRKHKKFNNSKIHNTMKKMKVSYKKRMDLFLIKTRLKPYKNGF